MYTYQDLLKVGNNERELKQFVYSVIQSHKSSDLYEQARIANLYNKHQNVTINEYQKILYTVTGKAIPDNWSANFKMACRHFHRFITQENQYLLGNGVTWNNESTEDKLGNKKYPFDNQLQDAGKKALWGGVSFGFYNLDHVDVFDVLEFAPLYDEENGSLSAGVRFWQVSETKPLRATLYQMDGYTEFTWKKDAREEDGEIVTAKRPYKYNIRTSEADGTEIYDGENYPGFPIVPMWANPEHQSELVGLREQIDCYDLIKSGFANTVDEASYVYWIIQNAGGMDDVDLAKFVERIKTTHAATVEAEGAHAESHQQDAPYASREALLSRLDMDMYRDAMALDVNRIASGAVTATQIQAAYEPLDSKCDDYEYCVIDFINGILALAGIDDEPTFTRSKVINKTEDIQTILQAAQFLEPTYVTEKILTILGDADQAEDMINQMMADALDRASLDQEDTQDDEAGVSASE